ncbi:MAG: hypothetical protein H0V82_05595 [Candidatus Protochlamydia sp.]|nr:hypothetical protein [Candidatus Protochlamydia sp.]
MKSIERRALYNLLRMNWLNDPNLSVEPWQVEDYRILPFSLLFDRLKLLDIHLDRTGFIAYADESDSPEDLTEQLIGDRELTAETEDQIYLLVFELWRRFMSEKPSVSILCNELDLQIFLYDKGELQYPADLYDALSSFVLILEDNVDEGIPAKEAFQLITTYFANDIETFLYDFISEQIEEDNESYAYDLLDDFSAYLEGNKWFELLRTRLIAQTNSKLAGKHLVQIMEDFLEENDLEFNLEILSFMSEIGDPETFKEILVQTIKLLNTEEDFQDLLHICADYAQFNDQELKANALNELLNKRTPSSNQLVDQQDPDLLQLIKIFEI